MTNTTNVVLYTGVTNNLIRRVYEHKSHADPNSFTARYEVTKLVYFEETTDSYTAISREKQIKGGSRKKKNRLIEQMNPEWKDLYLELI
ncbi:MAG: GIY-YIG nuclease family protein [Clostridia bacterium]|nr:GIY-YIG nuclease family protein [Clostridia bacterium]